MVLSGFFHHDIAEILLKVALNTTNQSINQTHKSRQMPMEI
jgi:hypothetical protein